MDFSQFLKEERISLSSLAEKWGVSVSTISRPAAGKKLPGNLLIFRAHILSAGKVGVADWIETCRPLLEAQGLITTTEGIPKNGEEAQI